MPIGQRTTYNKSTAQAFTSNVTLATVGLTSPIAAGQVQKIRAWIPITVGATGGVRVQVVVPAAPTTFVATYKVVNTVAPSITPSAQTTSTVVTSALANAGTHFLEVEAYILNGTTAGNVDIQIAQNTSDALTLTVLAGAFMEVVKL